MLNTMTASHARGAQVFQHGEHARPQKLGAAVIVDIGRHGARAGRAIAAGRLVDILRADHAITLLLGMAQAMRYLRSGSNSCLVVHLDSLGRITEPRLIMVYSSFRNRSANGCPPRAQRGGQVVRRLVAGGCRGWADVVPADEVTIGPGAPDQAPVFTRCEFPPAADTIADSDSYRPNHGILDHTAGRNTSNLLLTCMVSSVCVCGPEGIKFLPAIGTPPSQRALMALIHRRPSHFSVAASPPFNAKAG